MPYRSIVDDEQLATLTRIMDEYREQAGIEGSLHGGHRQPGRH